MAKEVVQPTEVIQPAEVVQPSAAPAEVVLVPVPVTEPTPEMMKYCVFLDIEYHINRAEIRPQYQDQVAKAGEFMKKNPTTTAFPYGNGTVDSRFGWGW